MACQILKEYKHIKKINLFICDLTQRDPMITIIVVFTLQLIVNGSSYYCNEHYTVHQIFRNVYVTLIIPEDDM